MEKQKEQQHFIQVWINGKKEKLPKKSRRYIAHIYMGSKENGFYSVVELNWKAFKEHINIIDWYLQPIPRPKGLTDTGIEKKATEQANKHPNLGYYEGYYDALKYSRDQMQDNLREELIKFVVVYDTIRSVKEKLGEQVKLDTGKIIDNYLNSKK